MPAPVFLAASDILSRFKRYVFLVITYVLGAAIMLLVFNIKNSVIDPEFMKYYLVYQLDFGIDFDEQTEEKYENISISENISFYEALNNDLKKAGIPAYAEEVKYSYASLILKMTTAMRIRLKQRAIPLFMMMRMLINIRIAKAGERPLRKPRLHSATSPLVNSELMWAIR